MNDSKVKRILQPLVQEYGLGPVLSSLGEIAEKQTGRVEQLAALNDGVEDGVKPKKPRATAPEYVGKMELPDEKVAVVTELAKRFQQKSFLPTFGEITNFCQVYEIPVPASRSRASAIPRVFKFIAEMEAGELQQILDDGMFSGPSRLGPISEGIRNYSRAVSQR